MADGGSGFNAAELLTAEALAAELVRRANIDTGMLERLADAVNNRTFDVFLFLWKYGPATQSQLETVFPHATLRRALFQLEAAEVVTTKNFKLKIQK